MFREFKVSAAHTPGFNPGLNESKLSTSEAKPSALLPATTASLAAPLESGASVLAQHSFLKELRSNASTKLYFKPTWESGGWRLSAGV